MHGTVDSQRLVPEAGQTHRHLDRDLTARRVVGHRADVAVE